MTIDGFLAEDAELTCQDLSEWENQLFAGVGDEEVGVEPDNKEDSDKENKGKEEEEITLSKAFREMADKLKKCCISIPDVHSQVSEIEDKINFTTPKLKQSSIVGYQILTNLYLPHSSSLPFSWKSAASD